MISRSLVTASFLIALFGVAGCNDTEAQPPAASNQEPAQTSDQLVSESRPEEPGDHDDHGKEEPSDRVHLTEAQRNRLDIKVGKAQSGTATALVTAPATVAFDSDRVARIGPRLNAKVLEVTADVGTSVEAGDTVAILDSVALGQAKARYLTAAARYGTRLAAYQRNRKLAEDKIISEATLLESRAEYSQARAEREAARAELKLYGMSQSAIQGISTSNGAPLSRYPLTTPMAGVVQQRDLVPGQSVSANETPVHVVDSSRMWIMIEADEQSLPRLQTGLSVELRVRPLPEQAFTGTVDWISSELDPQSRTVRVRATVANPDGVLKSGMFGTARIRTESERQYALVSVDAVQSMGERDVVFVPGDEAGAFRAVPVTLGDEGGGQVEVRQGLSPGDAVVVSGSFDLASVLTSGGRSASHGH